MNRTRHKASLTIAAWLFGVVLLAFAQEFLHPFFPVRIVVSLIAFAAIIAAWRSVRQLPSRFSRSEVRIILLGMACGHLWLFANAIRVVCYDALFERPGSTCAAIFEPVVRGQDALVYLFGILAVLFVFVALFAMIAKVRSCTNAHV